MNCQYTVTITLSWILIITSILAGPVLGLVLHPDGEPDLETWTDRPHEETVGRWGTNGSCVAVGPNYIVTTRHQGGGTNTSVYFGEPPVEYKVRETWFEPDADGRADLRLCRIEKASGGPAALTHYVSPYEDDDEIGSNVVIGGYGKGRGGDVLDGDELIGYYWHGENNLTQRWGSNDIGNHTTISWSSYTFEAIIADFDPLKPYRPFEACLAEWDSGGGWFVDDIDGQWKVAALSWGSNTPGRSLFNPPTNIYAVRIGSYAQWILSITDRPDTDADGIVDESDNCIDTANWDQHDSDADGDGDACDDDDDNDGTPDDDDNCPLDPNKTEPGLCGCGLTDGDTDADGLVDCDDNCPDTPNPTQIDSDGDGTGNACGPPMAWFELAAGGPQVPADSTATINIIANFVAEGMDIGAITVNNTAGLTNQGVTGPGALNTKFTYGALATPGQHKDGTQSDIVIFQVVGQVGSDDPQTPIDESDPPAAGDVLYSFQVNAGNEGSTINIDDLIAPAQANPYGSYPLLTTFTLGANNHPYDIAALELAVVSPPPCPCPGDMNDDGWRSPSDISAMVSMILPYKTTYYWVLVDAGSCADLNADGWLSPMDISALVSILLPHTSNFHWVPCPQ